jgi:Mechanosensitive ion channel
MKPLEFDFWRQIIARFIDVLPVLIGAIVLFIFSVWFAHIIRSLLTKLFDSIDLDKKTQRFILMLGVKSDVQWTVSSKITKLLYFVTILFGAAGSAQLLGLSIISEQITHFTSFLPHLFTAFVVIVFSVWAANFVKETIITTTKSLGIPSGKMLGQIGFYLVLGIGIITGLRQAGIQLDFLSAYLNIIVASLGFAFALSYGLASRSLFESFIGGFYARERILVGDNIKINDQMGEVVKIDATTLWLRTENSTLMIPLSRLTTEIVEKVGSEVSIKN